jgi:hypothetical protein
MYLGLAPTRRDALVRVGHRTRDAAVLERGQEDAHPRLRDRLKHAARRSAQNNSAQGCSGAVRSIPRGTATTIVRAFERGLFARVCLNNVCARLCVFVCVCAYVRSLVHVSAGQTSYIRSGQVMSGKARQGKARQGMARQGMARQGKARAR